LIPCATERRLQADARLSLAGQTEQVEVTAVREMVRTDQGAREGLITAQQIQSLSIISRGAMELLKVLPGTVTPDQSSNVGRIVREVKLCILRRHWLLENKTRECSGDTLSQQAILDHRKAVPRGKRKHKPVAIKRYHAHQIFTF
jgi:hypothetical protein